MPSPGCPCMLLFSFPAMALSHRSMRESRFTLTCVGTAGPRPRCSTEGRESWKRSMVEGGVHSVLQENYWQEVGVPHLTPP